MRNRKVCTVLVFLYGTLAACSSDLKGTELSVTDGEENVTFYDEFRSFDENVWTKETHEAGWTNQELQSYDPAQVSVGMDGDKSVLMITAERKDGHIVSGRINSKGKKNFRYGTLIASIRLPQTGNGLWPAFWMMGDNGKEWPANGEIDIMEMGDAEGIKSCTTSTRVNTALHFGKDTSSHEQEYYATSFVHNLQDGKYHTYTLVWNESDVEIRIDDVVFHSFDIKDNPYFHDNFFILFNLAVGGTFTGITDINAVTALQEGQKATMYVDWIKFIHQ